MLCCVVLGCGVLCSVVYCSVVLCCGVLCSVVLCCVVLCCVVIREHETYLRFMTYTLDCVRDRFETKGNFSVLITL